MNLGTKIGSGFGVVILLSCILGVVCYMAVSKADKDTDDIALDRVPRLLVTSQMQNNLLLGGYSVLSYTTTLDQGTLAKAKNYLAESAKQIAEIRRLAAGKPGRLVSYMDVYAKDLASYSDLVDQGANMLIGIRTAEKEMVQNARDAENDIAKIIEIMTGVIRENSRNGSMDVVNQVSKNVGVATRLFNELTDVVEELLVAGRDMDISALDKVRGDLPNIAKRLREVTDHLVAPESKKLAEEALVSCSKFSQVAARVSEAYSAYAVNVKSRLNVFLKMIGESDEASDEFSQTTIRLVDDVASDLRSLVRTVMILVVACVLIGIAVAFFITRSIVKPITATQRFAEVVADGNLDHTLDIRSNDEVGKLCGALRRMVEALKLNIQEAHDKSEQAEKATAQAQAAMEKAEEAAHRAESAKREGMLAAAGQLEGVVEIISSASTQLSAQIEQSGRGASESATRLSEAATAMNEMNATVQEVARNAGAASTASNDTKHKAEAGEQVVQQVVASIGQVQEVSLQLKADMVQLNESAQDISRIMGVISDIADQTNLLALNAAIEAARAGEAGRGFAVVADEVRKLAEKTMTSTLDVSNAIRAIQESTDKSMTAMDNAVARVGEATELANQSGAALEEIVATVDATSDQVQAIAAASEEQSAASEEINRSIIEVNDMSRLTADAMNEATKAVADMADQAHRLEELIKEMKRG